MRPTTGEVLRAGRGRVGGWPSGPLGHFPLYTALPYPLVGRDPHEDSGPSVTRGLAARRVLPYALSVRRVGRDVGASAVSLNAVVPPRSPRGRCGRRRPCHPLTVTPLAGVVFGGCTLPSLETKVWAVWLSPYRAGLAQPAHPRLLPSSAFAACSCSLWLSRAGKPLTQGAALPNPSFL